LPKYKYTETSKTQLARHTSAQRALRLTVTLVDIIINSNAADDAPYVS